MNYFANCKTINEVKAEYRKLALQYHPDLCQDDTTAIMQEINRQYAAAIKNAARNAHRNDQPLNEEQQESEILNAEQYKNALNAIINLDGINIELCGGWIWVTGNTYKHRLIFRANGFDFATKKKCWYFRSVEYESINRQPMTMEEIRAKHGSISINTRSAKALN
jgi:hypothetical protein